MYHKDFIKQRLGKKVDVDGAFGNQCTDLAKKYAIDCHQVSFGKTGNAKDWFNNSVGVSLGYTKVIYSKGKIPPKGAIIFWGYGVYGHVAIVDTADINQVTFLEQNGVGDNPATAQDEAGNGIGGNAIRLRTSSYNNIIGWLVDPTTSKVIEQALNGNSRLWEATIDDKIKEILSNCNNELRKRYK